MYDVTLSIYAIVSHKSDHIRLERKKMRRVTYVKKIVVVYPREKKKSERQMKNNRRKYIQGHIDC